MGRDIRAVVPVLAAYSLGLTRRGPLVWQSSKRAEPGIHLGQSRTIKSTIPNYQKAKGTTSTGIGASLWVTGVTPCCNFAKLTIPEDRTDTRSTGPTSPSHPPQPRSASRPQIRKRLPVELQLLRFLHGNHLLMKCLFDQTMTPRYLTGLGQGRELRG